MGAAQAPRILVVDNEALAVHGFKRCLRDHAEVVVASTFEEARALLGKGAPFDALVIDENLDPGSGLDLLAFARQHDYAKTPAILVTGAEGNHFVNRAHALRAEVLIKPFPPEQLRAFVRRAAEEAPKTAQSAPFPEDPVSSVSLRKRTSLAACIDDLRALLGLRQTWEVWYAIGSLVHEMKAFGPRAVQTAATATGQGVVKLHRCARVAARWSLPDVGAQLALRMRDGSPVSWRHLVALAPIESEPLRKRLLAAAVEGSLSATQLERLVAEARVEDD